MDIEEAKRRARRGPVLLLATRMIALLITFASTVTIARLLPPREFGLANMSIVLLNFGMIFRDFGLTNAMLRKGSISQEEMSLIFWFNACMTLAIGIVLAALAPAASRFFGEPIIFWTFLVSLVGFVLNGLTAQHSALMHRELRFGASAIIDTISQVMAFVVTLILAIRWQNVWAIVCGNLASALIGGTLFVLATRWRPGRPRRTHDMIGLFKFGANTSVFAMATFLSQNAATILIGRVLGPSSLGQYNRAQALFQMPTTNLIQPITHATLPLLTRLRQNPEEYRSAYLGLVRKLNAFLMPLSVIFMCSGVPIVEAVLGKRWTEAGAAFSALSPAFAGMGAAYAVADLFVTQDRSAELRSIGIFELFLRVGAVCAALPFGLVVIAGAYAISTLIAAFIRLVIAGRRGPVSFSDQIQAIIPSLPLAVGAVIGCSLAQILIHVAGWSLPAIVAILILSLGLSFAVAAGLLFRTSREAMHELAAAFGIIAILRRAARLFGQGAA